MENEVLNQDASSGSVSDESAPISEIPPQTNEQSTENIEGSSGDSESGQETILESENDSEGTQVVNETIVYESIDYTEQLETLIEQTAQTNVLLAQSNANQLFAIGCVSAVVVLLIHIR